MCYRIVFSTAVRRQVLALPGHLRAPAKRQIALLSSNPRPDSSTELRGHPGFYRLWLGRDHRLVWFVSDEDHSVEIHYVGPKPPQLYDVLRLSPPHDV